MAGKDIISDHMVPFHLSHSIHNNLTAFFASILTAVISLPVDNIKVKLQKQDKALVMYNGILDCFTKSIRNEGVLRLWVGLPIYMMRGTPHSFIIIRSQQFLTERWKKFSE